MDIVELKMLIYSLLAEVERLTARVNEPEAENAQLRTENADLRARLSQNSANSHKPPVSEGYQERPFIKPALPKQPGKKPGGQAGHPGQTLKMVEHPDLTHCHQVTHCRHCGLVGRSPPTGIRSALTPSLD